jgi:hypothetical protein
LKIKAKPRVIRLQGFRRDMKAFFTVDLDRDVNFPDGGNKAGSLDRGNGTAPRFTSSEKGAAILQEILDETGIKATFFAEPPHWKGPTRMRSYVTMRSQYMV